MICIDTQDFINNYTIKQELSRSEGIETFLVVRNYDQSLQVAKAFDKNKLNNVEDFKRKLGHIKDLPLGFIERYFAYVEDDQKLLVLRNYVTEEAMTTAIHSSYNLNAIWRHIIQCYACLHENGISPSYVKLSNIFITRSMNVILTDVYPMQVIDFSPTSTPDTSKIMFLAPEYFTKEYPLSEKSDIWSLGALMLVSFGYSLPWSTHNLFVMMNKMKNFQIPDDVPSLLKDLILKMLVYEPSQRTNLSQLLHSKSMPISSSRCTIKAKKMKPLQTPGYALARAKLMNFNGSVRSAKLPPIYENIIYQKPTVIYDGRRSSYTARIRPQQLENQRIVNQLINC